MQEQHVTLKQPATLQQLDRVTRHTPKPPHQKKHQKRPSQAQKNPPLPSLVGRNVGDAEEDPTLDKTAPTYFWTASILLYS